MKKKTIPQLIAENLFEIRGNGRVLIWNLTDGYEVASNEIDVRDNETLDEYCERTENVEIFYQGKNFEKALEAMYS